MVKTLCPQISRHATFANQRAEHTIQNGEWNQMELTQFEGAWTALLTPFIDGKFNAKAYERHVAFQTAHGLNILPVGTTGESPVLGWRDHDHVIDIAIKQAQGTDSLVMAGTGSNSTEEAVRGSVHALESGAEAVLLVDPYYNAPSSLELRLGYYSPVLDAVQKVNPDALVMAYVIPGRTTTELLIPDMVLLKEQYPQFRAVKEATGNLQRMGEARANLGNDFLIFSGDDGLNYDIMSREHIRGNGVVSVVSNLAPVHVKEMVDYCLSGDYESAEKVQRALQPLNDIVTVTAVEDYRGRPVPQKYRNPTPIKVLMHILGISGMQLREPLKGMGPEGMRILREKATEAYETNPDIFKPLEDFYKIHVADALNGKRFPTLKFAADTKWQEQTLQVYK